MTNKGSTAQLLISSDSVREQVYAALLGLGFSVVSIPDTEGNRSYADIGKLSACDLLVVDDDKADRLRRNLSEFRDSANHGLPAIVLLRDLNAASREADLVLDGILRFPLNMEETMARLDAIAHCHRVHQARLLPALGELGMIQRLLKSVTNGVVVADATLPDLPLVYVNPAFERMTGYSFEEVRGRNCRFLQGPDTQQPDLVVLREAIRQQRDSMSVIRNYRKDGTPFWNELYLSPLRDEHGLVTHFAGIQSNVTQRVEFGERLSFLAHHDSLTGLANRGLLFERLEQAVLRAARYGNSVALLFFDLNNFKHVNDVFGHDAGDALLKIVGERLQSEVREYDTVARLGGDEFVILLPDLKDDMEIPAMIERIGANIQEQVAIQGQLFSPSASVGWSLYPRDGRDPEGLLKAADFAMYTDKHKKRHAEQESETSAAIEGRSTADSID
jgi:diguanylate cyclase (GGDEF)-like protein/PAS domain S-box-containing protein